MRLLPNVGGELYPLATVIGPRFDRPKVPGEAGEGGVVLGP